MPVMDGLEFVRQVATVGIAKGVDIVILGNAWTVTSIAASRDPVSGPSHNQDGESVPGCRAQAYGREVRRPSSTAVVPSRVHL